MNTRIIMETNDIKEQMNSNVIKIDLLVYEEMPPNPPNGCAISIVPSLTGVVPARG